MKAFIYLLLIICSMNSSHQTVTDCQDPTDYHLEMQLLNTNDAYFWFLVINNNATLEKRSGLKRSFSLNRRKNFYCDEIFTKTFKADQYPEQGEELSCSPTKFMKISKQTEQFACEPVYGNELVLKRDKCQANGIFSFKPYIRRVPLFCQIAVKN